MRYSITGYLLLGLLTLGSDGACAKKRAADVKVSCVYSYAPQVILTNIVRADTATVLSFLFEGVPGAEFHIPDLLYLDDSQHRRYRMLQSKGVSHEGKIVCPLSEQVQFDLCFEPLPTKEKIFDLLSANHYSNFGILGITESDKTPDVKTKPNALKLCEDDVCQKAGKITIIGHFEGNHPEGLTLSLPGYAREEGNEKAVIASDGHFELTRELEGSLWTYLHDIKTHIPLFLTPGDTLYLHIRDCYDVGCSISYESRRGYDVHANLMKAAAFAYSSAYLLINSNTLATTRELKDIASEVKDKDFRLWQYLVWKFQLNHSEAHWLNYYLHSQLLYVLNSCVHRKLTKAYPAKEMVPQQEKCLQIIDSEEMTECYWFMRDIDLSDMSAFLVPDRNTCELLLDNYPAIMAYFTRGRYGAFEKLEQLIGMPLSDQWKRLVSGKFKEN